MTSETWILAATAASVGLLHTLLGPDHYLPFIAMAKAGEWSRPKTILVTILCGIGHVGSSVVLGLIGIAFGISLYKLQSIESFRGNIVAWALIAFGLVYFIWGMKRAFKRIPHSHGHVHIDGTFHNHVHAHAEEHSHVHTDATGKSLTPWVLFTIFVFGPCEPLIPLLMYPAAQKSMAGMIVIAVIFGAVTIATMLTVVLFGQAGLNFLPVGKLERFSHALAGFVIFASGAGIVFLGL
jgi:nickel/cobalt exporter